MNLFSRIFPIFADLSNYSRQTFGADLVAGLTVAIMLVPQGMAYAVLAGLPAIYGLYGGLIPILIYAFFGTSKQLAIGPVAVSGILIGEGIANLNIDPFTPEFIGLAITAGLLIGILQLLFGVFRMGFLVNFLSNPVIAGFTSAAAIIIAASQLKDVLGFKIPRFPHFYESFTYAFQHIQNTNWIPVVMCFGAMAVMLLLKKIHRLIPGALIVVFIGTLLSYWLNLPDYGLAIIGEVPKGLPMPELPEINRSIIERLTPTVLTVTIIGIIESIGIAKGLEAEHQNYAVRPNQELIAIGLSKIGGAFFQALPTSASFTRSAINSEAGAKSPVASLVTFAVIVLTLLFFTPIFYYLPKAILAAIILLAIRSLFKYQEAKRLWRIHRRDFTLMITTFLVTLIFGVEEGVLGGVILSIFNMLYRSSRPHIAVLSRVPNTTYYRSIDRFDLAEAQEENALIVRLDSQLFFANASFFNDRIEQLIAETKQPINTLFLDAKTIHNMDSSGLDALRKLHRSLQNKGIQFYICSAIGPVRDLFEKSGFLEEIGEECCFHYLHDGVESWKAEK